MSSPPKDDVIADPAVIAKVHANDVAAVRTHLRAAIDAARNQWLPADAIADALILELVEFGTASASPVSASAYLRSIASLLDGSAATGRTN